MNSPVPILVRESLLTLGSRVALARRARELTQIDLARLADVGVSTVASLEAGHHGVSLGNLLKVLKALELLEQVNAWLLPGMDEAVVSQGIRAATRGAGRRG
ncbi:MAG: helix-turn-helix domain-containing protein [Roseateles sp.]|uniref:helix-turn-helix domain-containing protein n=1 Tax=Roseateles sp. TaxID=1971397 RepID=UPI0039E8BF76